MSLARLAPTAEDTVALGRALALVRPDAAAAPVVLYLEGPLGAGKTTFARGFLEGCGVTGAVRSPTFTLLETYPAGSLTVVHIDLYRLAGPEETEALGLRDWAQPQCLWLIEWPGNGLGALPAPDLTLSFSVEDGGHRIDIAADSPVGEAWLERIKEPPKAVIS